MRIYNYKKYKTLERVNEVLNRKSLVQYQDMSVNYCHKTKFITKWLWFNLGHEDGSLLVFTGFVHVAHEFLGWLCTGGFAVNSHVWLVLLSVSSSYWLQWLCSLSPVSYPRLFFSVFLRQGLPVVPAWNSLCGPAWPWTQRVSLSIKLAIPFSQRGCRKGLLQEMDRRRHG